MRTRTGNAFGVPVDPDRGHDLDGGKRGKAPKFDGDGNYATAVSQDGRQAGNPFYLQYGQGAFAFSLPGGVGTRFVTTPELGRWYHLTGVRDHASGELRLFVDGERVAPTAAGADGTSVGPRSIGRARYAGEDGDFWNGSIDEGAPKAAPSPTER